MVICFEGQGYIARSVGGQSWLKDNTNLTYFHFILSLLINILLHKRSELLRRPCVISARTVLSGSINLSV